jgi:hypothetical protein
MSILSELQGRKLGLVELILMGFDVYLKNFKPILLVFCTINLPFLIITLALGPQSINNSSNLFWTFFWFFMIIQSITGLIYDWVALSLMTENYVYKRNISYQNIVKKIFSSLISLCLLMIRFVINSCFRIFLFTLLFTLITSLITIVLEIFYPGIFGINLYSYLASYLYLFTLLGILLYIPAIIYWINNGYYGIAFILRDQKGKSAFAYSRSIVKDNWWKVFFFNFLYFCIMLGLPIIFGKFFKIIPFMNNYLFRALLLNILPLFISIGIRIGGILLFLNLDYQKSLEP